MKKKLGYIVLIVLSIVGSRLIFGKDYHLNSNNILENNMYLYDIYGNKEVKLLLVDDEYLYYLAKIPNTKNNQYDLVKYNLINDKVVNDYVFDVDYVLENTKIIEQKGYLYLSSVNSKTYYKFDYNLNLLDTYTSNDNYTSYGVYQNKFVTTINNQIFYQDKIYDTVYQSCGKNVEVINDKDVYLHFHNNDTGFGCLYNVRTKGVEYLDYEKILIINNHIIEYQDNRQSFQYNGDVYYFNDITESNNLIMHSNGDYLFAIDTVNNSLNIYNLETSKIVYQKDFIELNNGAVSNILIDDYAYFTITKNNETKLYIWDYIKETRKNKSMISYDEKEYKFKNNEIVEEIKNKYNINIYLYDQAVMYFDNYYVIPSYDDILINSRLKVLKNILEHTDESIINKLRNSCICFEKNIEEVNGENTNSIMTIKENKYVLVINITDEDFQNNIITRINGI